MSTIVALATPPGEGALHVIRMSGKDAFPIINSIAVDPVEKTQDRLQVTFIKSRNGSLIDQVVLGKYYAPYSYTGEDCIEISCHGNGLISKLIIDELIKAGAVQANRGEFTKRAFLNGKIDLNQALNIGALFKAKTELDIYTSVQEIRGASVKVIKKYAETLFGILGECELNVDYPREIEREDDEIIGSIRERVGTLLDEMKELLERSRKMRLSNYRVVFMGRPNAGKSSLVNYLIGKDRIMVSDRAGTTQDAIEVDFCFGGYILTLVDTAGIESEEDFLKYEAANRSRSEVGTADLIIHLISCEDGEVDEGFWKEQMGNRPCIRVITKADLMGDGRVANSISTKEGNVEFLLEKLGEHLREHYSTTGIKSQDNINNLANACSELRKALDPALTLDLMLDPLHAAYDHLQAILGTRKTSFDKINMLFDGFCVGK